MTQMTPPPPPEGYSPPPQSSAPSSGTSKLAIAALVCSLIVCVPFAAPAAGAILAIAALVSISKSNGRVGGKGLAAAALVISMAVMVTHSVMAYKAYTGIMTMASDVFAGPARTFIQNLEAGDLEGARAELSPAVSESVTDAELNELKVWLADNCGTLVDVKWDMLSRAYSQGIAEPTGINPGMMSNPNAMPSQQLPPDFPAVEFVFDKGTYFGAVTITMKNNPPPNAMPSNLATLDGFAIIHDESVKRFPAEE